MYEVVPRDDKPDAFGFTRADFSRYAIEVLPDNETAYRLFCDMQTQWRTGSAGPTGLDYGVLFHKMDRMRLAEEDYITLEEDIRVMEYEALAAMHEKVE